MIVLKFGGTSVGSVESLLNVKKIVESLEEPAVVVVSALGGLTDKLIATAKMAASGNQEYKSEIGAISLRHHNIIKEVIRPEKALKTLARIAPLIQELMRLYDGVSLIRDLPEKTLNQIVSLGERISSIIVADMIEGASHHNALNIIKTEKWFDRNVASTQLTNTLISREFTETTDYPAIIGGFISTDITTGEITNLGRGGSDYTAALIAAALDASVLQIWTDVDGFLTADPRVIPQASVIPYMSFVESMDLCTFGAKVIYPPTIYPVFHKNIPIRILNTFHPDSEGTYITESSVIPNAGQRNMVTGISALADTALITLRGACTADQKIYTRAANALARKGINILLNYSLSTNASVSLATAGKDTQDAIRLLKEEFAPELVEGELEVIEAINGLSTLAVVGDQVKNLPGGASSIRVLLAENQINLFALSEKASETTLLFVIKEENVKSALKILHNHFFEKE